MYESLPPDRHTITRSPAAIMRVVLDRLADEAAQVRAKLLRGLRRPVRISEGLGRGVHANASLGKARRGFTAQWLAQVQLPDDRENRERRHDVLDGVAAQGSAEQAINLQVEGLEDLRQAVPEGRPGQQSAVRVALRRERTRTAARSPRWTSPGRRRTE